MRSVGVLAIVGQVGCGFGDADLAAKQRTIDRLSAALRERDRACQSTAAAVPPPEVAHTDESRPAVGDGDTAPERSLRADRSALTLLSGYELGSGTVNKAVLGGTLQYWLTDRLAIGASARWLTDRATPTWPAQETSWATDLEMSYTAFSNDDGPLPDLYLVGGVGGVGTRPLATVDPSRHFDTKTKVAFASGIGIRRFFGSALSLSVELRDLVFVADVENRSIAMNATDPAMWTGTSQLTNDVELGVGLTLWLPM